MIDEKIDIRITKTIVEVYFHGSRIASHHRLQSKQDIKPNDSAIKKTFKNTNRYGITCGTAYFKKGGDHSCVTG